MSARQRESVDPLVAGFGLLALWIAIELLYSSGWLRLDAIRRTAERQRLHQERLEHVAPKLITLLEAMPVASRKVWFAPYTTFPETGVIESRSRLGIYDTFLTFPRSGISSNYGAFNLSAADSLFAQASSQGLVAEAHLAQSLGYRQFALDLGAISQPVAAAQLCRSSEGCRISGDAYAVFPLDAGRTGWIAQLKDQERNIPLLPQISAAPRWGGLVGKPNQWWPSTRADLTPGDGRLRLRARPLANLDLYRYPLGGLPAATRRLLNPQGLRVRALLPPGLQQVDLCLSSAADRAAGRPCHGVTLQSQDPAIDITRWIEPGTLTAIEVTLLIGGDGLPTTMGRLVPPADRPNEPSPFTLEIQLPPPSPQP
ncbi:MAG: hypothetical protein WCQ20_06390 [Synechococcaceae cyanobacterium ELA739]